ncbi:MAG: hypothetical protein ABI559_03290 [Chloroflexota bacterium]
MNALPRVLLASLALLCAATVVACGGDDSGTATPSSTPLATPTGTGQATPTPRPTATRMPTPEPSPAPLTADSPEVSAVLALDGFRAFAAQFGAAIAANDAEWIIANTHFEVTDCPSPGEPLGTPTPRFCQGMAYPQPGPGILVAVWSGDGDTITQERYEDETRTSFAGLDEPGQMYAVGPPVIHSSLWGQEAALVVSNAEIEQIVPREQVLFGVTAYQVARLDDVWQIVQIDAGTTDSVPYYLTWYAPWSEVFPAY